MSFTPVIPSWNFDANILTSNYFEEISQLFGGWDRGNYWMVGGGLSPMLAVFNYPQFNRLQRWCGRYIYKTNPLAQAGVENLTNLVIGEGFTYKCKNKTQQKMLDEFLDLNNWDDYNRESFQREQVDGEVFEEIKKNNRVVFLEPDYVFDSQYNGIETDPFDPTTIKKYHLTTFSYSNPNQQQFKKELPPEKVNHRKLGWMNEKRGISVIFSVMRQLTSAIQLLNDLTQNCNQLVKIAMFVESEVPKEAAQVFNSEMCNQQVGYQTRPTPPPNVADIDAGAILHFGNGTKVSLPGSNLNPTQYLEVYSTLIKLCAARFGTSESSMSKDRGAVASYNGEQVVNAVLSKSLEAHQRRIKTSNLNLFEKALGIPKKDIQVIMPEVSIVDRNEMVAVSEFLLNNQLASKQTIAKKFDVDYDEEVENGDMSLNKVEDNNAVARDTNTDQ